jgi:hypothetical protein
VLFVPVVQQPVAELLGVAVYGHRAAVGVRARPLGSGPRLLAAGIQDGEGLVPLLPQRNYLGEPLTQRGGAL